MSDTEDGEKNCGLRANAEECQFDNDDNISYGLMISPRHDLPGEEKHGTETAREPKPHPLPMDDETLTPVGKDERTHSSEDSLKGSTNGGVLTGTTGSSGYKDKVGAGIYEEYITMMNLQSVIGNKMGMEEKEEVIENPDMTNEEDELYELCGTEVPHENTREDEIRGNILGDPYYSIIFSGDDEPGTPASKTTQKQEDDDDKGKIDAPYYSVIQNETTMQDAEEVVYHYPQIGQTDKKHQKKKKKKRCHAALGKGYVNMAMATESHDTAASGYANVNSGTMATDYMNPSAMATDYVNMDPNAMAADYVNVDPTAMATGSQDTVMADYINIHPGAMEEHDTVYQ